MGVSLVLFGWNPFTFRYIYTTPVTRVLLTRKWKIVEAIIVKLIVISNLKQNN